METPETQLEIGREYKTPALRPEKDPEVVKRDRILGETNRIQKRLMQHYSDGVNLWLVKYPAIFRELVKPWPPSDDDTRSEELISNLKKLSREDLSDNEIDKAVAFIQRILDEKIQ